MTDRGRQGADNITAANKESVNSKVPHEKVNNKRVCTMRLVTFNVQRFHRGAKMVAHALRSLDATVAALQEVASVATTLSSSTTPFDSAQHRVTTHQYL